MKSNQVASALTLGLALLTGCTSHYSHKGPPRHHVVKTALIEITQESVQAQIANWPETSKLAANMMIQKYGLPMGVLPGMLVWNETGPFKRSIVIKDEVLHNFPTPHKDVLQQFVHYKVPADKLDEIGRYNGSILVDKTRGELSARCNNEQMNLLALNLAHEIVDKSMSVETARRKHSELASAFSMGSSDKYTNTLHFEPRSTTAFPDVEVKARINRSIRQAQEEEEEEE